MLEILCELILQIVVELFLGQICQFLGWAVFKLLTLGRVDLEDQMATFFGFIFVMMVGGVWLWEVLT